MIQKMIFFAVLLLFAANIPMATTGKRTALVIGNGSYRSGPLKNSVNDAVAMARVLKKLGFDVILKTDVPKKVMLKSFREFSRKLLRSEIGLFYFAGHGMQINGINYLIPVHTTIREESEVEFESVAVSRLLAKMKRAGNPLNIVILDACRDNPFKRSFRTFQKGFVQMNAPLGTVIAYATSPGSVAADGDGRNGTYTEALLKNFQNPNLDIQKMFNQTGLDVMKKTNKQQVPWVSTTPFPDYFLAGKALPPSSESSDKSHFKLKPVHSPLANKSLGNKPVTHKPAKPEPGDAWTDPVLGMEFVRVPGGCFKMGQTKAEKQYLIKEAGQDMYSRYCMDELPLHKVCVDGFWMAKTEVTRGQFKQFVKETGYRTDADKKGKAWIKNKHTNWIWKEEIGYNWKKPGFSQTDIHPVVCVSWNDAKVFINWLNQKSEQKFSLPTEAQWEYAARGGTKSMRFWGDSDSQACNYANVADKGSGWDPSFACSDGYQFTAPVGTYLPNPFGLFDMLGNAWEWCEDVYDKNAYSKHDHNNPFITSGSAFRVDRGGSWDYLPKFLRAAYRRRDLTDYRDSFLGFRLTINN
ncbi:SUMF1/EgtB/PvdO family nonheme iron enzyme [Desulfobacula phenolica]|uniref:Formylglycine-generating enzyme, required for sulfatase activity, contains SUMF1/FGE domain n=1 Tax=Desulfobacula phenolica TaxID=90732 RepID=A0A1H2JL75_9BACT|nr:SUMF1/EgtB/PvdO family nonheme iron enzyme [Desulfobacula phenolica]SDU57107.1 Formylglycine-generating enzyme, required for sulfatase activity, contains SUMF1/FGE domain [Desulfobacula phenolica]